MSQPRELSFTTAEIGLHLKQSLEAILCRIQDARFQALAFSMASELSQGERARVGVQVYLLDAMGARAEQITKGLAGLLAEASASASLADSQVYITEGEPCRT